MTITPCIYNVKIIITLLIMILRTQYIVQSAKFYLLYSLTLCTVQRAVQFHGQYYFHYGQSYGKNDFRVRSICTANTICMHNHICFRFEKNSDYAHFAGLFSLINSSTVSRNFVYFFAFCTIYNLTFSTVFIVLLFVRSVRCAQYYCL